MLALLGRGRSFLCFVAALGMCSVVKHRTPCATWGLYAVSPIAVTAVRVRPFFAVSASSGTSDTTVMIAACLC